MNNILKTIGIMLISILISGCATNEVTFQNPIYDKENKSVNIDGFKIKNVTYHTEKESKPTSNIRFVNYISYFDNLYKFDNDICKEIRVRLDKSRGQKYFTYSKLDDTKAYYDDKCIIEQLYKTNVYFVECPNKIIETKNNTENKVTKKVYGVIQSTRKNQGYGDKLSMAFVGKKQCFDKYKNYLLEKYKPLDKK